MLAHWRRRIGGLATIGLLTGALLSAAPATAKSSSLEVIADGLDNPRGLAFGADGALYVAEAGRGGNGACIPGPVEGEVCYGATGAITRVANGKQQRVVTGLPSLAPENGEAAAGPHDVVANGNGRLLAVIGLHADPARREDLGAAGDQFGQLLQIGPTMIRSVADLADYESTANPDGGTTDSNPISVALYNGKRLVVDAGANALLAVGANGRIETLAVFPERLVDAPPFLGLPPGVQIPMQAVPDTVAVGSDGAIYVGELTGFPFPQGAARVYRVIPGQKPTVYADGFTNIIDLAVGSDGSLYVLELAANGLISDDPTGALIRMAPDGTRTTIAQDGLVLPGGVAIGPDKALYVSNFSIFAGQGQVVRIEP